MVEDAELTSSMSVFVVWQVRRGGEPTGLGWVWCLCGLICRKVAYGAFYTAGETPRAPRGPCCWLYPLILWGGVVGRLASSPPADYKSALPAQPTTSRRSRGRCLTGRRSCGRILPSASRWSRRARGGCWLVVVFSCLVYSGSHPGLPNMVPRALSTAWAVVLVWAVVLM